MMYGFLDESPSLHDKAYFFCVDILLEENPNNKEIQTIIKRAREKLPSKEKKRVPELKFANTLPDIRQYVLKSIAKYPARIVILVVETDQRRVADIPENYGLIVGWALVEATKLYPKLSVTLDRKFVKTKDREEMEKMVHKIVDAKSAVVDLRLIHDDSKRNAILQLADFVAGALNAKYNYNDDSYWKIIKPLIAVEKLTKWVSLKAATKKE